MKVKVERGSQPLPLFEYLFRPDKQREVDRRQLEATGSVKDLLICQTIPGSTAKILARNFRQISKLNPNVTKTIAHYSISLPSEDSQKVQVVEMRQISRSLLEKIGHGRSPYFGIAHHDTGHRHWHLAASTISYDGNWVNDSYERNRIRTIEKALEIEFDLKQSQTRPVAEIKNLSTGEYRLKRRTQKPVPKEKLWAAIDDCIQRSTSLERFILELRVHYPEISIQLKKKAGKHVGISFGVDNIAFAGRSLGRAYSLNGLNLYHGIKPTKSLESLTDELLVLPDSECKDLYESLEHDAKAQLLSAPSINPKTKRLTASQIEP